MRGVTRVLVVGVAVVDFVFFVDEFPVGPAKYRANGAAVVGGGCAANAAVAISRLGGEAILASRLGGDSVGETILGDLEREGVDTTLCDRSGERSSFSSIYVDGSGERQIVNYRGSGLIEAADHVTTAPEVNAILADTRWSQGALAAMKLAQARGVPGVLDVEAPTEVDAFEHASHLAFSQQGLLHFYPDGDPARSIARAAADYDAWVCVTLGPEGVLYHGPEGAGHVPGFRVGAVDTLGAGDVWHGAFALGLAEGRDEVAATEFANAVAAIKCTRKGGRAGTPTRAETETFQKERA